jgi:uncharacterized membrane protein
MIKEYINNDKKFDIGIISLIIVLSGIFGFIYEFIFYYFNGGMKTFYYQGGNFLPWINIYAIGALLIIFLTYKLRKSKIKVFLISILSTGLLELISGYLIYKIGNGTRYWDYNTEILNFGNVGGYICLRSVLFFGLSSLLLIYGIVPMCYYIASKMNKKLFLIISFSICFIFLFDEIYNLVIARIINTPRASDIYKKIGFKYMDF